MAVCWHARGWAGFFQGRCRARGCVVNGRLWAAGMVQGLLPPSQRAAVRCRACARARRGLASRRAALHAVSLHARVLCCVLCGPHVCCAVLCCAVFALPCDAA